MERCSDGGEDQGVEEACMGQKKAKNHHVSFDKSLLARAALPFSVDSLLCAVDDSRKAVREVYRAEQKRVRTGGWGGGRGDPRRHMCEAKVQALPQARHEARRVGEAGERAHAVGRQEAMHSGV